MGVFFILSLFSTHILASSVKYTVSSEWEFIHHCVLARPAVCEVHVRCQVEALSEIRINPTVANIRQGNFHSTRVIRFHNESLSALNSLQSNITLQQLNRNCEPIVTKRHGINGKVADIFRPITPVGIRHKVFQDALHCDGMG